MTTTVYKWMYGQPLTLIHYHGSKAKEKAVKHAELACAQWCYGTVVPDTRPEEKQPPSKVARKVPDWDREIPNESIK